MAMFVAGGGMDDASAVNAEPEAVEAPLGFLLFDWLKRRAKELLRAGRVSVAADVKDCMLGLLVLALVLAGTLLLKEPGAGKSFRVGS